ncbi:Uncharacterised protein [Mycobacteroides abscessus subsp. massiliense]|nr:Uncharacterised protein [Mycobacteroides abscessus subsp. massiliense]
MFGQIYDPPARDVLDGDRIQTECFPRELSMNLRADPRCARAYRDFRRRAVGRDYLAQRCQVRTVDLVGLGGHRRGLVFFAHIARQCAHGRNELVRVVQARIHQSLHQGLGIFVGDVEQLGDQSHIDALGPIQTDRQRLFGGIGG